MKQWSAKILAKRWTWFLASYVLFTKWAYSLWYRAGLTGDVRKQIDFSPARMPADANVAYTDFQARIGMVQLNKLDSMLARRRALAELYDQELRDVPGICPAPLVNGATYSYYTMRVPRRDQTNFRQRMASRGIAVDQSFDYALPYVKGYRSLARDAYPEAALAASEVVNLPCYPGLEEVQAKRIAACVRDCIHEINRS